MLTSRIILLDSRQSQFHYRRVFIFESSKWTDDWSRVVSRSVLWLYFHTSLHVVFWAFLAGSVPHSLYSMSSYCVLPFLRHIVQLARNITFTHLTTRISIVLLPVKIWWQSKSLCFTITLIILDNKMYFRSTVMKYNNVMDMHRNGLEHWL